LEYWEANGKRRCMLQWKYRGVVPPMGLTMEELHDFYMSVPDCETCGVELTKDIFSNRRCLDHSHVTGAFRKVVCHRCNMEQKRGT